MNSTISRQWETTPLRGGGAGFHRLIGKEDQFMPIQNDEKMKGGKSLWEIVQRDRKEGKHNNQIFSTGGGGAGPAIRWASIKIGVNNSI